MGTQKNICPTIQEGSKVRFMPNLLRFATVKTELNKALEENKKLKSLFSPEKMVRSCQKESMP